MATVLFFSFELSVSGTTTFDLVSEYLDVWDQLVEDSGMFKHRHVYNGERERERERERETRACSSTGMCTTVSERERDRETERQRERDSGMFKHRHVCPDVC